MIPLGSVSRMEVVISGIRGVGSKIYFVVVAMVRSSCCG